MIDWFTGLVGYDASGLLTGQLLFISPAGEITRSSERWLSVPGSYESSMQIKRDSSTPEMRAAAEKYNFVCSPTVFRISGNPTKFIQGHNVFGPPVASLGPVVREVIRRLPGGNRPPDANDDRLPAVMRSRVDVTTSIRMDNHAAVHEWIEHAKLETRSKHKKRDIQTGLTGAPTVSWGIGSRRWMITAYCKACELEKHPPANPELLELLRDYADGLLRIELRLQSMELKDRGTLNESIIWTFFDRIEVGVMKKNVDKAVSKLRPPVKNIYTLWLDGHDITPASGRIKRAAFYKYRKEILEATGQDISLPPVKKKPAAGAREQFGVDYLKGHEVKNEDIPAGLREHLYKPGDSPTWPAH